MNKKMNAKHCARFGFAIAGSIMTILFFFVVNCITGLRVPWFIFPSFAVLWWPLAVIFNGRRFAKIFSLVGCVVCISFVAVINYTFSPGYFWFLHAAFALLWWPLSVFFAHNKSLRLFSVLGALLLLAYLVIIDYVFTPSGYPWFLYAACPILLWPVCVFLGRRAANAGVALLCSVLVIAYYVALNVTLAPGFPWAIFPAYAVLWWPLSVWLPPRGRYLSYAVSGTLLTAALLVATNLVTSPQVVWAVYPIFAMLWWPLSTYYFVQKRRAAQA